MLLCLNLAGTLVASDLRSCEEEEEETKEDEEKKRKEGQGKRKEEQEKEAAELVVGDRIPPTEAGRSSKHSIFVERSPKQKRRFHKTRPIYKRAELTEDEIERPLPYTSILQQFRLCTLRHLHRLTIPQP